MKKGKTFKIGSIIVWSAISLIDLIAGLVKASDAISSMKLEQNKDCAILLFKKKTH